jgi:hypothetical protein
MDEASAAPPKKSKLPLLLGCGCLAVLILCGGGFAGLLAVVSGAIKSSGAYQGAMTQARASAAVTAALGTPIEEGFMPTGNVQVQNDSGNANLIISISGPKGAGTVHAVATKSGGQWSYSTLTVEVEGGESLDLLSAQQPDSGG